MSAWVSMVHANGAHLFTDAAVWNGADQTLREIRRKVTVAKSGRVAVTSNGDAEMGRTIAREICDRADRRGAASVLVELGDYAAELQRRLGIVDGAAGMQIMVTGYVEGIGGMHRHFRTHALDRPAYAVVDPGGSVYWSGTRFKPEDIGRFGLGRRPGEVDAVFIRRFGIGVLDVMRYRRGRSRPDGPLDIWCVGGWIDCTTISAGEARTETFARWRDVVGEVIDPFRDMSRSERRRLERMVAW